MQNGQMEVLTVVDCGSSSVALRRAAGGDVPAIVSLLAADQLGATRDGMRSDQDLANYRQAFAAIDSDPAHVLVVAEAGTRIVGTLQLSFIPGLAQLRPTVSTSGSASSPPTRE